MIRPLAAVFALFLISLDVTPPDSFASGQAYPPSVLRIRGGFAFPDPDHQDPGPAWSAGGSVGVVLNRNILLSLSYDHIDLDEPDGTFRRRAIDPLTLEMELGLPTAHRITPRLAAGAGPYFHDDPRMVYSYYPGYAGPPQRSNVLRTSFGMHFGGGIWICDTSRQRGVTKHSSWERQLWVFGSCSPGVNRIRTAMSSRGRLPTPSASP